MSEAHLGHFIFCLSSGQTFFMPLTREKKQQIIAELKEKVREQKAMLFFDHSGLKAKDLFFLRKKIKEEGDFLKVVKKSLFLLALEKECPELKDKIREIEGQLAVVFSFADLIGSAKAIFQLSKEYPALKVWGGWLDGTFQPAEKIMTLAQLPSREELLTKLTSTIFNPVSGLVMVLQANLRNLVFVISQIKSKESS